MVRTVTTESSGWIDARLGIGQLNWDAPQHLARGQLAMERLFPTLAVEAGGPGVPLPQAQQQLEVEALEFADPLGVGAALDGGQFLNRRLYNDALLVCHRGRVVHESYRNGMGPEDRHVLHSCSKTMTGMLVAIAVAEGRLQREQVISNYVPELAALPAWQGITLQQVLDMQAGIAYSEDYSDPEAHYWGYARAAGYYPPLPGEEAEGIRAWMLANLTERQAVPGTQFVYNSCLTNILGMALEAAYGVGLAQLFEDKLYRRIGAEADAYFNTDRYGFAIAEGQLSTRLRDFARLALLLASGGRNFAGEQLVPAGYTKRLLVRDDNASRAYHRPTPDPLYPDGQYKEQVWVLDPDRQRFSMLGIHGQFAWYDLQRELLLVGFGSYPQQDGTLMMRTLDTLWQTIARQF